MKDCQDSLDSESNNDNERDQSTFPGMKFFKNVTLFFYVFGIVYPIRSKV